MKPVRILQVVTVMNRGGLETMLMNYYRRMDRSKIQFDFMVHRSARGHYDDEIESLGGVIYRLPQIRPGNYRLYFKELKQFFDQHTYYDVVHSHMNENSSFVLHTAKKAGIPCRIAHSHLSDLGIDIKLPFRVYAKYRMKDNPTHYFACSKNAGQWLFGKKIGEQGTLTVMNNAINAQEFALDHRVRERIRNEMNAGERLVIGHVGRFNEQKNHEYLIEIFHQLYQQNKNVMLVLIGEGKLQPSVKRKAENLGLTEQVLFLGVRSDISELMQGMDLFVFPSLFEGLPVVLVEAQASGLRCIVSDTITRDTDVTGRIEFVSLKKSPRVWAQQILKTSHDRVNTVQLLQQNRYDTEVMAEWLADFYMNHMAVNK
ncbi:glycosyltransferase family 1 protein [Paenibacillus sp. BR2-3]|uniref:glycosyltransferase family 1 protein n=1 Tax=Paenibacillus sp. BR2-3 TaxID=3048494 RepID=UPI0039772809